MGTVLAAIAGVVIMGLAWRRVYVRLNEYELQLVKRRTLGLDEGCPTCGADRKHFQLDRRAR